MKRTIFSILICLLLVSCEAWTRRQTNYHYIINQTDKEIVHILYSDHDLLKDSFVFHVCEKNDTTLEWIVSEIIGFGEVITAFHYNSFSVFDLTDTTSYKWDGSFGSVDRNTASFTNFFTKSSTTTLSNYKSRETNWIKNYYLTVNDSLLSLMQKDYSMTERFKEYYQK